MNSKSVVHAPEIEFTSTGSANPMPNRAIIRINGNPIEMTFSDGADRVINPNARLITKIDSKIGSAIANPPAKIRPVTLRRAS